MSSLSHSVRLAWAVAVIGIATAGTARSAPQEAPGKSADSMKAYPQLIPGTELVFDMVPIPGGTFEMDGAGR